MPDIETRVGILEVQMADMRTEVRDLTAAMKETNESVNNLATSLASWKYAWPAITMILTVAGMMIGWVHFGLG